MVKKKKKVINYKRIILFLVIICFICIFVTIKLDIYSTPFITNISIDDNNNLNINYFLLNNKNAYYLYKETNELPEIDDSKWIKINDNNIIIKLEENKKYFVFLKINNNIKRIEKIDDIGEIKSINYNKNVYLAINGSYQIDLDIDFIGNVNKTIIWSSNDENIAKIDENGLISGISEGTTTIDGKINKNKISINVTVTNLIVNKPTAFDKNKSYLSCDTYTEEENDLLDKILKSRIDDVGYSTRAGVVEAARFLTLEFPYRIDYFYENGRMSYKNKVDGEGRYYHVGLYLNSSRYTNVTNNKSGPKTWGCSLYSNPISKNTPNGLDCSGFVSWVLLNGGFDPGDIGAGITSVYDLTDTGKRSQITSKLINSNEIKVGDLLWKNVAGGHIAIIIGIDSNYYYVAESIANWSTHKSIGVIINTYKKSTLSSNYNYVILMDSYYKSDGKLTDLWY